MTKTPFKDIADLIGHGEATAITAELTALRMRVEQLNAELKMAGKPTLDEQTEEALSDLIEELDAGKLENDPELKEIAMDAKRERQSHRDK
jgi:polyhydroxyalkanoate synthesis regulator phasin